MKINKITIHNLASIADATIDFTQQPLNNTPLFIICGETGSGKTTITDAICLSFYKQTPRFDSAAVDRTNRIETANPQNNEMLANDPRNIMRKGTIEAYAQTTFEGDDGNLYLAEWKTSRARKKIDGSLQTDKNTLYKFDNNTFIPIVEKQKDFDNLIISLTGYDYKRFVRCVLLAQNQFSKFLLAKTDEKAGILQMLTDTSIYETISKRIFERRSIENEKLTLLRQQLSSIVLLSDDEIAQRNKTIEQCNNNEIQLQKQLSDIEQYINYLTQQAKLKDTIKESEAQHNKAIEQQRKSENLRQEINAIQTAIEVFKTPFDNFNRSNALYKSNCQQFCNTFNNLKLNAIPYTQFDDFYTNINQKLVDTQNQLLQYKNNETKFKNIQQINLYLDTIVKNNNDIQQTQNQINNLKTKIETLKANLENINKQSNLQSTQLNTLQGNLKTETEKISKYDFNKLTTQLRDVNEQIRILAGAIEIFKNIEQIKLDLANLQQRFNQKQSSCKALKNAIDQNTPKLQLAATALETAKESFNNLLRVSNADLKKLRQSLHEGEECPLCGAKNHPFCTSGEQVIDNMLQSAKQLVAQKENEKNTIANNIASDTKLLNAIVDEIKNLETNDIPQKQQSLQIENNRIEKIRTYFGFAPDCNVQTEVENKKNLLNNQKLNTEQTITFYTDQQQIINNIKQQIDNVNAQIVQLTKQTTDTEKTLATTNTIFTEKQNFIGTTIAEKQNILNQLQPFFVNNENIDADASNIKTELKNQFQQYSKLNEQISDFNNQLLQLNNIKTIVDDIYSYDNQINKLIQQENQKQTSLNLTIEQIKVLLNLTPSEREAKLQQLRQIDNYVVETEAMLKNAIKSLEQHNKSLQLPQPNITIEMLLTQKKETFNQQNINTANKTSAQNQLTENIKKIADYQQVESNVNAQQQVLSDWDFLNTNFGSKNGDRLKRAAQTFTLKILLENANRRLIKILPRYTFQSPEGTLDILVHDLDENAVRPVSTVSGGEGFMLSLALALGLSDMMQTGKGSDTLFVDEGFGTLDSANLQKVVSMLEKLHLQGRKVGIISHVPELKERIPIKISVEKCPGDNTKSIINIIQ